MTGPNIGLVLDPDLNRLTPGAQDLLRHWQAGRAPNSDAALPLRAAFDPLILRRFLGNLLIVDIERTRPGVPAQTGDSRFRYRLIGTDVVELSGRDMTGRYFEDVYDPVALAEMRYCFGWVADSRRPARVFGTFRHAHRAFMTFDALFLPVATEEAAGDAAQIIGYVEPTRS
ncbi:PAS domain-containing protein [Ferrovibrio sp.]|uniref:PAS domain-containing protein n=1 Tax=Ferrovibrio sp. TaxID=1917215 RepID=UPI0035139DAD